MYDPCEKVLQKVFLCIMKHPCIFGFFFGTCIVMVWWTCSRVTLASRSFQMNDMRIFPVTGYVEDIYDGSLETLGKILKTSDLRFVVFYAPWCAQSRKMVPQMGNAAEILRETFDFIAINCWIGTCKQNFSLHEFPKFFAYHSDYPPVEFLEPPETWRIVQFLQSLERPFHHIGHEGTLQKLISSNEALMIGYFNVDIKYNQRFSVFLELCIASVNRDSKPIFGVVTSSRMAALVGIEKHGQVILHQILGRKVYFPSTLNFTVETILSWISKHHIEFVTRLSPSMVNLDYYISQLKRGPALLLFISRNEDEARTSLRLLQQYRQTAAIYYNCTSSFFMSENGYRPVSHRRAAQKGKPELCFSLLSSGNARFCDLCHHSRGECLNERCYGEVDSKQSVVKQHIDFARIHANSCSCLQKQNYNDCDYLSICCVEVPSSRDISKRAQSSQSTSSSVLSRYIENVKLQNKNRKDEFFQMAKEVKSLNDSKAVIEDALGNFVDAFKTLMEAVSESNAELELELSKLIQRREQNLVGRKELKYLREKARSKEWKEKDRLSEKLLPKNFSVSDFNGLRCKTNRTLSFFYLDVENHSTMMENLGIKEKSLRNHVVLTLVDLKNEATFVMNERLSVSHNNVVHFITNYTNGLLQRHLRAHNSVVECSDETCIEEVTTKTFKNIILDDSKDVFLMYYAPWCGYCKQANRIFLQLARFYRRIPTLRFARINADRNELPYHLTVDGFPSFILFPMSSKAGSEAYPDDQPIRLKEMKDFLIKYSSKKTRRSMKLYSRNVS